MIGVEELRRRVGEAMTARRRAMIGCGRGLLISVSSDSAVYYVRYTDESGRQRSVRLGDWRRLSLTRARERAQEEIARARSGSRRGSGHSPGFAESYEQFLRYMAERVSKSRMENLRTARRHLGTVLGDTPLTQIVPLETVEKLRRRLSEDNTKNTSPN